MQKLPHVIAAAISLRFPLSQLAVAHDHRSAEIATVPPFEEKLTRWHLWKHIYEGENLRRIVSSNSHVMQYLWLVGYCHMFPAIIG